ncbi:MAG: 2-dehydropantoate 2-reductase [Anaerolineae bacterium]|nr:2-dehydropantoate 2-reductase [Anaerolineae bacterium]
MRFVVFGAGAIGSAVGGHLARAGEDVLLVTRPTHAAAISARGLRLITSAGTLTVRIAAVSSDDEIQPQSDDVILLAVKSQDTEAAVGDLARVFPLETPIFCAQNGVGNEEVVARAFRRVYGMMVFVPAIYDTPGIVTTAPSRRAGVIEVGLYPEGSEDLAGAMAAALQRAGYASRVHPAIMQAKWAKLIGNLGNAVGAITDGKGDTEALTKAVRAEAEEILRRAGISYEPPEKFRGRVSPLMAGAELPAGTRYLGSTWLSLARRTGSVETDWLNGEIVRLARARGLAAPLNEGLCRVANEMARQRELPGKYPAEELYALLRASL